MDLPSIVFDSALASIVVSGTARQPQSAGLAGRAMALRAALPAASRERDTPLTRGEYSMLAERLDRLADQR